MIIKSIEIKNFRQFKGIQKIIFSTAQDENITLIQGDNTSGKTTLLQAFLWCLYGQANFKSKDALINTVAAYEMQNLRKDDEVKVSIELSHHGVDYIISRTLKYMLKNGEIKPATINTVEMSYKETDGQMKQIPSYEIKQKIEEILPADLSTYFLYDTERFGNITTKSDVTDAVKGILGLTVLEHTIDHIGKESSKTTLLGKFYASLNLTGNNKASEALQKMQEAEEKKEEIINRKKEKTKELEHYLMTKGQLEEKLRTLEASARLQKERDLKQKELSYENGFLIEQNDQFFKNFKANTFIYLANPLMKKALIELQNADVDDKGIKDMNANSIKDIIVRGKCVCGTEVVEGNVAHKHLLEEINFLPPESIGNIIRNFKEKTELMLSSSQNYMSNLEGSYKNAMRRRGKIAELEDEIDSIKTELEGKDSVGKYQENLTDTESKIRQLENLLLNLEKQIWEQDNIISSNKTIHNNNVSTSEKNKEILEYMAYATAIKEWVEKRYKVRESDIRIKLEEKVNEYFSKIYHGKRKVKVDEKYKVTLITTSSDQDLITDESQGLETVKNFAFISGLVDMAKEKLQDDSNSSEKDSEDYPLILDAPFSNADERHVENISKVLPEVASQLVLIVMAKDWNYAEKAMGKKVGKRYFLDKKSEVLTKIVEVNN
ncbi:hypothetical protein Plano_2846 [Planococcus sp. PAMC 21323]|uniref:AAA family ATPase n=1 Tax=Planococcus sp. PAMC 21323 TaxID=1526927 RepID=UPI000572065B|nr:AAA family ATPase [Planococcus sp. PAMC 21323]AIY06811.1 hypothetical protein Plano_2846 [Planococcus sp. PAMC 21323]